MTTAVRTRAEIEREITGKRRERELYVSPQGVAKCHAEMDELLAEWVAADDVGSQPTA